MDSYVMKFPLFLKELWVTMLDRARKANQLEKKKQTTGTVDNSI